MLLGRLNLRQVKGLTKIQFLLLHDLQLFLNFVALVRPLHVLFLKALALLEQVSELSLQLRILSPKLILFCLKQLCQLCAFALVLRLHLL